MTEELKPCPFCGSAAIVRPEEEEGCGFYVCCSSPDCFCCIGEGYDRSAMPEHSFAAREDAIAAWNRRAPPDEAAAIRAACDEYVPDAEKACFYPECACDRDG
ncbi:MAG: Lar family restriction alleviation protein, partial [Patescibacteria group bacterium]|nr:Lar family restriction alleviation protein [Patescibacteria group bacterium]